jgi:hypothetical protein
MQRGLASRQLREHRRKPPLDYAGSTGCVRRPFRARVSGRQIAQVTFFVDAARRQTIKAKPGQTVFSLRLNPRRQNVGRHRITAKVRFTANSATRSRTLRLVYQRCSNTPTGPRFTADTFNHSS